MEVIMNNKEKIIDFYSRHKNEYLIYKNRLELISIVGSNNSFFTIKYLKFVYSILKLEEDINESIITKSIYYNDDNEYIKVIDLNELNNIIYYSLNNPVIDILKFDLKRILKNNERIMKQFQSNPKVCMNEAGKLYFSKFVSNSIYKFFQEYKNSENQEINKNEKPDKPNKQRITMNIIYNKLEVIENKLNEILNK